MNLVIPLKRWKYAEDSFLPLAVRAPSYFIALDDLPTDSDPCRRAQALHTMHLAERHRYILPSSRPAACTDLVAPHVWPAVWVAHPLGEIDTMRIATLMDCTDAWCRIVLSPKRSAQVLAAARAAGAVVLEATR